MSLLKTVWDLRSTLGSGAKFATTQVLNVCLPGSGAVVELVGQLLSDPGVKEAAKDVADAVGKINEERWKADVTARLGATEQQVEEVEALLEVLQRDMAGLLAEVRDRQHRPEEVRRLIEAEIAGHPEWQKGRDALRSVVKRVESLEEWRDRLRSQGLTTGFMGRHGARPAGGPQVGDTLDGWRLEALAGRGGMGRVFRATKCGATMAVKVMSPELSGDPAFETRFKREMMALARLDPHPGLVGIEDFGKCGRFGCWYLVMPFVEGETLQARLERAGALGADAAREVFAGLAGALASAHGRGVFHRDIKPANVILTAAGRAVLVDFGVARVAGGSGGSGGTGLSAYTALFAAPEQMRTGQADARSDVYSLAATLYYALRYDDPSARDPHRFKPGWVTQEYRTVLRRALASNPDDRHSDADAFRKRLMRSAVPRRGLFRRSAPPAHPATHITRAESTATPTPGEPLGVIQRMKYLSYVVLLSVVMLPFMAALMSGLFGWLLHLLVMWIGWGGGAVWAFIKWGALIGSVFGALCAVWAVVHHTAAAVRGRRPYDRRYSLAEWEELMGDDGFLSAFKGH